MAVITVVTDDNLEYFKELQDAQNEEKFALKGEAGDPEEATRADIDDIFVLQQE